MKFYLKLIIPQECILQGSTGNLQICSGGQAFIWNVLYHIYQKKSFSFTRVNPLLSQYKYREDALKAVTLPLGPIGMYLAFHLHVRMNLFDYICHTISTWFCIFLLSHSLSFSVGGGSIALAGDGGLRQWQITNTVNHVAHVPDSFFAIRCVCIMYTMHTYKW